MENQAPFAFPKGMPREEAERLLKEAYESIDPGRILRKALKRQRSNELDPPSDVQYVTEVRVDDVEGGLGVTIASDILLYDAFEGMDECVDIFEATLGEELMERLERRVKDWVRRGQK